MALDESLKPIADSSFLIGLCLIDQLFLIPKMVKHIYVTPAVWDEVVEQGYGKPASVELQAARFISIKHVLDSNAVDMLRVFLGKGEAESLVLAREMGQSILFTDDLRARKMAQEAGIPTMGVAGFLLAAKQRDLIQDLGVLFDLLKERGFRLSKTLITTVLRASGEFEDEAREKTGNSSSS